LKVPYFSQWESADLAAGFISNKVRLKDDPLWRSSGAASIDEYAEWANHLCGMACFKMILAAHTGKLYPILELARLATELGAYVLKDGTLKGMIYAPAVEMLKDRFAIEARVITGVTAADLATIVRPGSLFIASVHPTVRWLSGRRQKRAVTWCSSHKRRRSASSSTILQGTNNR